MKTETALAFYKGSRLLLASAAGVTKQAVNRWVKTGIVPEAAAYRLKELTRGKLKVDPKVYA
jgi:hypothetical protein